MEVLINAEELNKGGTYSQSMSLSYSLALLLRAVIDERVSVSIVYLGSQ